MMGEATKSGEGASRPAVLLMSATIAPSKLMPGAHVIDPQERLNEYKNSLEFYLGVDDRLVDRIVFAENSGSDLSSLRALADSAPGGKRVEFVQFVSDRDPRAGKGYSEFHMLDRAVAESRLVADPDHLWKVSGRLKVTNLGRMVATAPADYSVYCDLRSVPLIGGRLGGNDWMDCRVFSCSVAGYRTYLRGQYERMGAGVIEQHLFPVIKAAMADDRGIVPRFRVQPRVEGVCGRNGASYRSPSYRAKEMLRKSARVVMPALWL